jgi:hypothetical protein
LEALTKVRHGNMGFSPDSRRVSDCIKYAVDDGGTAQLVSADE